MENFFINIIGHYIVFESSCLAIIRTRQIDSKSHSRHRMRLGRRNLDELQIWQYMISAQHVQNQIANLEEIAKKLAVCLTKIEYRLNYDFKFIA